MMFRPRRHAAVLWGGKKAFGDVERDGDTIIDVDSSMRSEFSEGGSNSASLNRYGGSAGRGGMARPQQGILSINPLVLVGVAAIAFYLLTRRS